MEFARDLGRPFSATAMDDDPNAQGALRAVLSVDVSDRRLTDAAAFLVDV
jgi:hypothetical protein